MDPRGGGPGEGIRQLTPLLQAMGHATQVVSLDAPAAPWLNEIEPSALGLGPGRSSYGFSPRFRPWLQEHLREYDIAIIHGIWQFHSFCAYQELRAQRIPYVVYPHGMLDPWFRRRYPLKHYKKQLYWWIAEQKVLSKAQGVLFTSDEERRLARESFWPYHAREFVVNYGIQAPPPDLGRQQAAFHGRMPALRGKRYVLFLGRIYEKKGPDLILEALRGEIGTRLIAQDMHVLIAGPAKDQAYRFSLDRILSKISPSIAKRVHWLDVLQGDEKWGALRGADCFILPSHQENFGIAVVEALACGIPVLISNQVNIWKEIVLDGAGLAAADTVAGTAQLLQSWLQLDSARRSEMRGNAGNCFQHRFELTRSVAAIADLLVSFSKGMP